MRITLCAVAVLFLAGLAIAGPPRGAKLSLKKGLPKAEGLGKLAILSNLPKSGPGWKAVKRLADHRDAKILWFPKDKVRTVESKLKSIGPEFVALAVTPTTVDMNFQLEVLELCRGLDRDPMPDFHFGYLCARTGEDLAALIGRIIAREAKKDAGNVAKTASATPPGTHLAALDYVLHFGHGQPWRVNNGLTAEQVTALELPRSPVIFSGACFTGVLSRSYHKSAYQRIFLKPVEIAPEKLISLSWVHAGVSGYFAPLEGDRGEMAMAEWAWFRERACSLGETIGYQYRLAFTSLPEDYEGFPRYVPGQPKRMWFYDVMLRGMTSRILVSDPSFRPLEEPLDEPVLGDEVAFDAKAKELTVTVSVKRWSQGHLLNYLPKSGKGVFDRRVFRRIALPGELLGFPGKPEVRAALGDDEIPLTRFHVRHEVWGGARYLCLQAESEDGRLGKTGASVEYRFPVEK